jgi:hypothetical protein
MQSPPSKTAVKLERKAFLMLDRRKFPAMKWLSSLVKVIEIIAI